MAWAGAPGTNPAPYPKGLGRKEWRRHDDLTASCFHRWSDASPPPGLQLAVGLRGGGGAVPDTLSGVVPRDCLPCPSLSSPSARKAFPALGNHLPE